MVRKNRQDAPGHILHFHNRGVGRRTIAENIEDMRLLLSCFARMVHRGLIEILAYALLPNHFHFLVKSCVGQLSKAVGWAENRFARRFNRRRNRDGPLYRGRYGSHLVAGERYLVSVVRYIDLNPVRAGLVARPDDYPYGSAIHYAAPSGPIWLSRSTLEELVCRARARRKYRPGDYAGIFGRAASEGELEVVERRASASETLEDPLDDLFGAAPRQVRAWMVERARLADAIPPGLPFVSAGTVEDLILQASVASPRFGVTPGRREVDGWPILRTGLLRDCARLTVREIAARSGFSQGKVFSDIEKHRRLLAGDEAYADLAASIVADAIRRDFPELPAGPGDSEQIFPPPLFSGGR